MIDIPPPILFTTPRVSSHFAQIITWLFDQLLGGKVSFRRSKKEVISYNPFRSVSDMDNAFMIIDELYRAAEKQLKLGLPNKQPQASYETGVLHGMHREQQRLLDIIYRTKESHLQQLKDFMED